MGAGRDNAPAPRFSCICGALHGRIAQQAIRSGTRLRSHCADCRAEELVLGQPDPDPAGVDLLQTTPDAITFDGGIECLGLLRLGPNGLLRWYATCCDTPLFNTLKTPKLPFVGIHSARLSKPDLLGPIRVEGFVPRPGKNPAHKGAGRMVVSLLTRMIAARLSGRWRETPLFDTDTGVPVATPRVLTREERAAVTR